MTTRLRPCVFALVAYAAHYRVRKIAERRVVIARRDSSRQVVMRIAPYIYYYFSKRDYFLRTISHCLLARFINSRD